MCNFVPGDCIGIAPAGITHNRLSDWALPGNVRTLSLPFEDPDIVVDPFHEYEILHVYGIPEGLEMLTVSKLSAMLADEIAAHRAVVELNYLLPFSTLPTYAPPKSFTPPAEHLIKRLKRFAEDLISNGLEPRATALLDSGINPTQVHMARPLTCYDYAGGRADRLGPANETLAVEVPDHDSLGHGTSVSLILDTILPESVHIVSGRVAKGGADVPTVLSLARAFAHLVAAVGPAVVNISLAPRDDTVYCPHCGKSVAVPAFHSTLLPFVFHLAADTTIPVIAAGNRGRPADPRLRQPNAQPALFAVATGSSGSRTSYSNYVEEDAAWELSAFGGDPAEQSNGCGIFADDRETVGTSFAAPFVSGAAMIADLGRAGTLAWGDDDAFYNACRFLLGTWTPTPRPISESDLFHVEAPTNEILITENKVIIGDIILHVRH